MRKLLSVTVLAFLASLTGCRDDSEPGGPGAVERKQDAERRNADRPNTIRTDDRDERTFTLEVPKLATDVKRGQREEVTLSIDRGAQFKEEVKLKFNPPKGIKVLPADAKIARGETKTKVFIEAMPDAMLGKTQIEVQGIPESGKTVSMNLPVEIERE